MTTNAPARYGQPLTDRELQILRLVATGLTNAGIGAQIFLSTYTIKTHMRRMSQKLGAHSRTHMVAIGAQHGLLTIQDMQPAAASVA